MDTPKALSVTEQGERDDFVVPRAWRSEFAPEGGTRLVVSVPTAELATVYAELVKAMGASLGFLYRQKIDRVAPKPSGAKPIDFVALDLPAGQVVSAIKSYANLFFHDARCELWTRGALGEQLILDEDGVIYCYPDDPSFRRVLTAHGLEEKTVQTLAQRDYVKHWFHAENDALEARLLIEMNLTRVS